MPSVSTAATMWRLLVGALALVSLVAISSCGSNRPVENNTSAVSTPPADETVSAPPEAPSPTPVEPAPIEPIPPLEEVQLVAVYLRSGAQPNQHYVQVENTLAGPTPCRSDSLMVVLEGGGVALQWQTGQRLEIFGAYVADAAGCRVRLDQAQHTIKVLPPPEPPEPTPPPEPEPPVPEVVSVRLEGTVSAVQNQTAYFLVERTLRGPFPCELVGIALDAPDTLAVGDLYELEGEYDPTAANCRLLLTHPLRALRLTPVAPPAPVAPPTLGAEPATNALPFFVSGGVSMMGDIPVLLASAGMGLTNSLKGMLTAGMGSGRIEVKLPSGEPIQVDTQAVLVEAAALYNVSGPFYAGASAGALLLSGEYRLPYPPAGGSSRFNATVPMVGVVLGYDLGFAMATVSLDMALGGGL